MKKILYAAALLCIIASCSKEEVKPATPNFFFVKLYWEKDSLVSFGHPDKDGPLMDISRVVIGSDTNSAVVIFPRFNGKPTTGANEPYFNAIKIGADHMGMHWSVTQWFLKDSRDQIIVSVPGTERIFIHLMDKHPDWGDYAVGQVSFQGHYSSNPNKPFLFNGRFRVKRQ